MSSETGWSSNAACFFTGLINPAYAYGLLDGTIHLCEEAEDPERNIPYAIASQVGIGFITGMFYIIAMMYSISDIDAVLASDIPNQEVYLQAMRGGRPGALLLQMIVVIGHAVALCDLQLTQARMTWSFARDGALPFSGTLSKVNTRLRIPLNAQLFGDVIIVLLGFLYLFAAEAFNALVGSSLVLASMSYILPISAHMLTGRKKAKPGPFWMGKWGWIVNFLTLGWLVFEIIIFNLPYFMPVVGDTANMNWTCAVVGGIMVLAGAMWFIQGKNYKLPTGTSHSVDDVLEGLDGGSSTYGHHNVTTGNEKTL